FLLEALPAILVGFVLLLVLPNGPSDAKWLSENEKSFIQGRLTAANDSVTLAQEQTLAGAFKNSAVWLLCLLYFLMNVGGYGYEMWLPTVVKGMSGQGNAMVGLISAIPYFVAGIVMYLVSRHSDLKGERRGH